MAVLTRQLHVSVKRNYHTYEGVKSRASIINFPQTFSLSVSKSFIPSLLPSESTYRAPGKYQGTMPGAKVQAERWTSKSLEHPGVKSCEQSTQHRSHLWCKKETAPWPPPTFSALTSLIGFFRQARPTCGFTWPQPAKGLQPKPELFPSGEELTMGCPETCEGHRRALWIQQ